MREMTRQFAAKLRDRFGERVLSIRLFGSYAKGGAHEHSDIDVAVVLDRLDWPTKREAIELALDVEQDWDFAISLMPATFDRETYELWREQERALVLDIENEGIPSVMEGGRRASAAEELGRAFEELSAADTLLAGAHARIAQTRIYFAVFHALRACLYHSNLEPRSHDGVLALFGLHFVNTGRFDPAVSRFAGRLRKYRLEADYGRDVIVDDRLAREDFTEARELIERIRDEFGRPGA